MIREFLKTLKELEPEIYTTLQKGAEKEEIHDFEHSVEEHRHLTQGLREFYGLVNGQKGKSIPFFADCNLHSLDEIRPKKREYKQRLDRLYAGKWHNFEFDTEDMHIGKASGVVKNRLYSEDWLPLMSSEWEYYFMDFDPDKDGEIGQIILVELDEDIDEVRLSFESFNILQWLKSYDKLLRSRGVSLEERDENEEITDIFEIGENEERVYEYGIKDMGNEDSLEKEIDEHFESYIGKHEVSFYDSLGEVSIKWIKYNEDRPFNILYTNGMSKYAMETDDGDEVYAELMVYLPEEWKIGDKEFEDDNNYWPVHLLKELASFPKENSTYISEGDTFPNGEMASDIVNTRFGCAMIIPPYLFANEDFLQLERKTGEVVNFYAVIPLYKEEMEFKLKHGLKKLLEKLNEYGVDEVIDIDRENTCERI